MQFSNTLANAIKYLVHKHSKLDVASLDITYADSNSKINYYVDSQTSIINLMRSFLSYTSHVYDRQTNTLADIIRLYNEKPVTQYFTENEVIKDSFSMSLPKAVKIFKTDYITKVINSDNTLEDKEQTVKVETGLIVGEEENITPYNYIKSEITYELNKKKTLHNDYANAEFELWDSHEVSILEIINVSTQGFNYKMLVTELSRNPNENSLIVKGLVCLL